jgi:hypothetical protein
MVLGFDSFFSRATLPIPPCLGGIGMRSIAVSIPASSGNTSNVRATPGGRRLAAGAGRMQRPSPGGSGRRSGRSGPWLAPVYVIAAPISALVVPRSRDRLPERPGAGASAPMSHLPNRAGQAPCRKSGWLPTCGRGGRGNRNCGQAWRCRRLPGSRCYWRPSPRCRISLMACRVNSRR